MKVLKNIGSETLNESCMECVKEAEESIEKSKKNMEDVMKETLKDFDVEKVSDIDDTIKLSKKEVPVNNMKPCCESYFVDNEKRKIDAKDRKSLANIVEQCKAKNITYNVKRSQREGFRYALSIKENLGEGTNKTKLEEIFDIGLNLDAHNFGGDNNKVDVLHAGIGEDMEENNKIEFNSPKTSKKKAVKHGGKEIKELFDLDLNVDAHDFGGTGNDVSVLGGGKGMGVGLPIGEEIEIPDRFKNIDKGETWVKEYRTNIGGQEKSFGSIEDAIDFFDRSGKKEGIISKVECYKVVRKADESCDESCEKKEKVDESVKLIADLYSDYKPWSGAVELWNEIVDNDLVDALDFMLEDIYPEGLTMTQLNDLLWFEPDFVREQLGLVNVDKDEEEE